MTLSLVKSELRLVGEDAWLLLATYKKAVGSVTSIVAGTVDILGLTVLTPALRTALIEEGYVTIEAALAQ